MQETPGLTGDARTRAIGPRVLITGATGFIGGRLCEVMALNRLARVRAFVHSTGAVARIARLPLEFAVGDLCDRTAVDEAVRGCDAVVHLARGESRVMRDGLENVLRAAVRAGVRRFVHMSSVAVYGTHPPPESVSECARVRQCDNEYGREKLRQERVVLAYARRCRLPVVILRPPNVYGPFSSFTLGLLHRIRESALPLVNDGSSPCNLVYVDNLVQAVLLALSRPEAVGETFFVTDADIVSWRTCLTDHACWLGAEVPHVAESELTRSPRRHPFRESIRALPQVLASSDFRSALRPVPVLRTLEERLYRAFGSLSPETQNRIRMRVTGPGHRSLPPADRRYASDDPGIAGQFRTVVHSHEKAKRLLGYTAPLRYQEGMQLTEQWLRSARVI